MFELVFGIIWTGFTLFMMFPVFSSGGFDLFLLAFFSIFLIVGVYLIIRGGKKVYRNIMTNKHGEECYAVVTNVLPTGTRINDCPVYEATFAVYVPSLGSVQMISEEIGLDSTKYPISSFVKGKFFNNDINIVESISYDLLPLNVRGYFDSYTQQNNVSNYNAPDIITVNGVQYKRIDDNQ